MRALVAVVLQVILLPIKHEGTSLVNFPETAASVALSCITLMADSTTLDII